MSSNNRVEGDVSIHTYSDSEINKMAENVRKAKELKKEAQSAEKSTSKKDAPKSKPSQSNPTQKQIDEIEKEVKNLRKELRERNKKTDTEKLEDLKKTRENLLQELDPDAAQQLKNLQKDMGVIKDKASSLIANPNGFIQGEIFGLLSKAGPASMVAVITLAVIDQVIQQFEDGGVFDRRIEETQQARTLGSLNYLYDINAGVVLFNESAYLTDEPPTVTNTEKLIAGQMRYYLYNSGDYVGVFKNG